MPSLAARFPMTRSGDRELRRTLSEHAARRARGPPWPLSHPSLRGGPASSLLRRVPTGQSTLHPGGPGAEQIADLCGSAGSAPSFFWWSCDVGTRLTHRASQSRILDHTTPPTLSCWGVSSTCTDALLVLPFLSLSPLPPPLPSLPSPFFLLPPPLSLLSLLLSLFSLSLSLLSSLFSLLFSLSFSSLSLLSPSSLLFLSLLSSLSLSSFLSLLFFLPLSPPTSHPPFPSFPLLPLPPLSPSSLLSSSPFFFSSCPSPPSPLLFTTSRSPRATWSRASPSSLIGGLLALVMRLQLARPRRTRCSTRRRTTSCSRCTARR